jgi:diphthamide synthase (EF-2-diphthine--ammonia ligase)
MTCSMLLQDEAALMEERLRRKAELQKKMASPKTFNESLQNELVKQGDQKSRTQAERRNAMCEELGRGC